MEDKFFDWICKVWQEGFDNRQDSDYIVNHPQYERFRDLFEFFVDMTDKFEGEIEPVLLEMKEEFGGLIVKFPAITFKGDDLKRFYEVTECCSVLGFEVTYDEDTDTFYGVCTSFTIPDIFMRKV